MLFSRKANEKAISSDTLQNGGNDQTKPQGLEADISTVQLTEVTYFSLFRYATRYELLGLAISSLFAIAGGAVLPCLTVRDLPPV
jgi:hypothetical protein